MSNTFKDSYRPLAGDMCARRLREDRYEVSVYDGEREEWKEPVMYSLAELNKRVRTQHFLGRHLDWEYYRPGA